MNVYQAVRDALVDHRTFPLETFLALDALFSGVILLLPNVGPMIQFNLLTLMPDLPPVPLGLVGSVFAVYGVLALAFVFRRDISACRRAADMGSLLWSVPLVCAAIFPPAHVGWMISVFAGLPMLGSIWVSVRLQLKSVTS